MQGNINVHHTLQILGSLLVIRAMSSALLKHHTVLVFCGKHPHSIQTRRRHIRASPIFFLHSWGFPPLIHSQGSDCQCRVPQVTSGHNRTFGPTSHFHYAIMPCCARSQHTEEEVFAHRPCYLRDLASQNEIQVVVLLQWAWLSGFCKHANPSTVNGTPKE